MKVFEYFRWLILATLLITGFTEAKAQMWSVGLYVNGLNIHLKQPVNPHLFHRTLNKSKKLVYNLGLGIRISYYYNQYAGLTITQAIVPNDCANKFFGTTHIGAFLSTKAFNTVSLHEGIIIGGPLMFYRKSWTALPDYKDDGTMRESRNKRWQYRFVWHGGFIEYQYHYNKNSAAGIHIMPGIPEIISVSAHNSFFIK